MNWRKITLSIIGATGAAIFLMFFMFTYSVPGWVEEAAADYIESEARARIESQIESVSLPGADTALGRLASAVVEANQDRIDEFRANLENRVHEKWAAAIAEVRDLDCECRQRWEEWLSSGWRQNIQLLEAANEQVSRLIHANYMQVTEELRQDIRIFTGSNAAVFLLLLAISFLKPRAVTHLFLPGILLVISTLVCSYFYIFEQNWLLTIIHNSYVGYAYLGWLGFVFLLLLDIVFNRGRVTTEILNAILNAIGSAVSVVPC
ncbi:MAG: hypothetical protein AAF351_00680 [Pseudomonadota bacterium]